MFKRAFSTALLILLLISPTSAQENLTSENWIPADFAGFLKLNLESGNTLLGLNMAAFVASFIQPSRFAFEAIQSLDAIIPLAQLDVEDASFNRDILPWLGNDILLAYKQFGNDLIVDDRDLLLILPSRDALQSASSFRRILENQDLLERETYRGMTLYLADKSTIAFTPQAVIIGETEIVKSVLDLQVGVGERLVDTEAYQAIRSVSQDGMVSAYINGSEAMRIFSFLMSGGESTLPLFKALGEALGAHRGAASFEQIMLGDSLDGVGVSLRPDTLRMGAMHATVTLYDADRPEAVAVGEFNAAALNMIPQNAMIVQDGSDAAGAVYDLLYALPLTNFAGRVLGGFPVRESAGSASGSISEPTRDNIEQAVSGVLAALDRVAGFDLQDRLLQYLSGSYAVALIPRPNNPNPLNLPYDVIVIAEVNDDEAALDGLALLTRAVLGLGALESITIGDLDFQTVEVETSVEPALSMGVVDHMLVVATGSALESMLDARRGDNRLISRPRWQAVSKEAIPNLYVDIPAVYNTFFPQAGGTSLQRISQLGAKTTYLGDGLYRVDVQVILPGGLG